VSPDAALVWYAAYGSNLCRERFLRYLAGGPVPGTEATQQGSRDPSGPRADRPYRIPRTLYFAGTSRTWGGGGVAYLDADEVPTVPTLGRLWLITIRQLEDVYRQENREPDVLPVDLAELIHHGELRPGEGAYGRLVHLGSIAATPVVTFTSADRRSDQATPHESYREVIVRGLGESWGLDRQQALAYLAGLPQPPGRRLR
jgi:hypothetical protein